MGDDQITEYELCCLLEDLEKVARSGRMYGNHSAAENLDKICTLFDRARMNQVIRYPVPA